MGKIALVALLASLAGCGAVPKPASYGSFATTGPAIDKKIADDAVKKLVTLYPPALTRFDLKHAAADPFGTSFVDMLRARGYALQEYKAASRPEAGGKDSSHALSYMFDQPFGADLYRVTLTIDTQNLSRVYLAKDGSVAPAGYWVRKE
jgi:hypothetical protein